MKRQDKVQALIDRAEYLPCGLSGYSLEVRDIASSAEWYDEYHLAVPVLTVPGADGREVMVPRLPPRTPADRLQKQIEAVLASTAG